jgi:hypothetical protein
MTARKGLQKEGADEKIPGGFWEANRWIKRYYSKFKVQLYKNIINNMLF